MKFKEIKSIFMTITKTNLSLFIKINLMNSNIIIQVFKTTKIIIKIIFLISYLIIHNIVTFNNNFNNLHKLLLNTTKLVINNLLKHK